MPRKILIAPDKFKGTLSAEAAAKAIAKGWRAVRPRDRLALLPVTDGGDGFGSVVSGFLGARPLKARTVDAAHRPCQARWWWAANSRTALIESASAIGLAMLPPGRFHPFQLDSFGLGTLLRAARAKGARRCVLGIGGSATNDGGFGLARALGWEFLTRDGRRIEQWTDLPALYHIRPPSAEIGFEEVTVAVDVQNPLLGRRGASRIYGPQKGLRPADCARAEACLRRLARVASHDLGRDFSQVPGAGAAGGLGFGLAAFAKGTLTPGFDWFARQAGLEDRLRSADLVITGEGALDRSSFMGKASGQIAQLCRKLNLPCIAMVGEIASGLAEIGMFHQALALTELTSVKNAKAHPAFWLERLARQAARNAAFRSGTPVL